MQRTFASVLEACLLSAISHAQEMVPITPDMIGPVIIKRSEEVVRVTRHDGITGELLYDSAADKQLTEKRYAQYVQQGFWSWTERKPYHNAIVIVKHGDGQGSGVLCWRAADSSIGLVATATHVMGRGTGTVVWQNGHSSHAMIAYATPTEYGPDGSLIWGIPPKDAPVIPIRRETPAKGAYVEHCGFGGPADNLRHFWGTVREYDNEGSLFTNCYLLNGDSGGPVLYEGNLVGMNSGSKHTRDVGIRSANSRSTWPLHFPARSCGPDALRWIVAQLHAGKRNSVAKSPRDYVAGQICFPGSPGCPPGFRQGGLFHIGPNNYQGPSFFPPQSPGTPTFPQGFDPFVPPGPNATPVQPGPGTGVSIDYNQLADTLIPKLADDERFRGPKGDPGARGNDGRPGRDGKDGQPGTVTQTQVAAMTQSVVSALAKDPRLKGAAGIDGSDGRGLEKLALDPKGNLIAHYTDGSSHRIGNVLDLQPGKLPGAGNVAVTPSYYEIVPRQ